jgi:hypothetical protein
MAEKQKRSNDTASRNKAALKARGCCEEAHGLATSDRNIY